MCASARPDLTCESFGSRINIYVDGTISEKVLQSRLYEALTTFDPLVTDQNGIASMDTDENDIQLEQDGGESRIEGGENELSSQSNTVAIVGIVAGSLILVFLLVCGCRKCVERRSVAHLKLENETEDNRAITIEELASSDSDLYRENDARIIHLDENYDHDGLRSDWSPYSDKHAAAAIPEEGIDLFSDRDIYLVNHPRNSGVHHECSAATCMICEARRRGGVAEAVVQAIHNNSPPRPTPVPTYPSSRWYLEADTVEL